MPSVDFTDGFLTGIEDILLRLFTDGIISEHVFNEYMESINIDDFYNDNGDGDDT